MDALTEACRRAGVTLVERTPVTALDWSGGRVAGIRAGDRGLAAETVVLASGAWSGEGGLLPEGQRPAHPVYEKLRPVTPTASVLLAENPSPMTLEGTNSWVLNAPGSLGRVVVDPGHEDVDHLRGLVDAGPVELILLTHHHGDHAEGAPWFAERVGAPVRAFDPASR